MAGLVLSPCRLPSPLRLVRTCCRWRPEAGEGVFGGCPRRRAAKAVPGCGPTLSISDSPAVLAGFSAHPQDVSWLCAVSRALSQCCVSERNSAVPALMSSYRPPRPLHTRGASSAPGNPGAGLDGRLSPSACLGEVGHSGHGSGIFCPILGPAQGVEGQGLPEVSVALARPGRDHQGCRLHPTSCHRHSSTARGGKTPSWRSGQGAGSCL